MLVALVLLVYKYQYQQSDEHERIHSVQYEDSPPNME